MGNENREGMSLPRNIRQIGSLEGKYRVYIEDFVYTYVHRVIHQRRRGEAVLAAVLLGRSFVKEEHEYVFVSGAQKVEFGAAEDMQSLSEESRNEPDEMPDMSMGRALPGTASEKQAEFWDRVYQRIKQSFEGVEIMGWYFNMDGGCLEINPHVQKFFESAYGKGARFLYLEDRLEQEDAFFVQEQHKLQRLSGYAVYYEKNPQMQQFMIEEKERMTPKPLRENAEQERRDDVVQNYRAIMNKLNEKTPKRKLQPAIYAAGAAVLVIAAATAVTQIGSYQNLKLLQQTMQTLSGTVDVQEVSSDDTEDTTADTADTLDAAAETADVSEDDSAVSVEEDSVVSAEDVSTAAADTAESTDASEDAVETDSAVPDYYVVQKGDNLMAISQAIYNTTGKVDEICALNGIEDMNMIYEGQTLLLP